MSLLNVQTAPIALPPSQSNRVEASRPAPTSPAAPPDSFAAGSPSRSAAPSSHPPLAHAQLQRIAVASISAAQANGTLERIPLNNRPPDEAFARGVEVPFPGNPLGLANAHQLVHSALVTDDKVYLHVGPRIDPDVPVKFIGFWMEAPRAWL